MEPGLKNASSEALFVTPGKPLQGELGASSDLSLPGDKSLSHRAALFAALADGDSRIGNFQVSGVTRAMLNSLTALGVSWELEGKTLMVEGRGLEVPPVTEAVFLDCGNSATTLRLLAGALAAWGAPAILDGSLGLRRRPMQRIVEPLRQMGVSIQATNGCAPLVLQPGVLPLHSLDYTLPVASAQVKACLLLAALSASGPSTLMEPGPTRDHTERMLRSMGVDVTSFRSDPQAPAQLSSSGWVGTCLTPPADRRLAPFNTHLPGDISAAAFLIVAALIVPGSRITLRRVGLNPTRTGLLDVLRSMGGEISISNYSEQDGEPLGDITVRHSDLHAARVEGDLVVRMIDEFPIFAVAAAYASGESVVVDAEELRHKESDRISDLGRELRKLGVEMAETPDGFIIQGGRPLSGGEVQSNGDHRLAMSLAVAGLAARSPVTVHGAGVVHESFPDFTTFLSVLGANLRMG